MYQEERISAIKQYLEQHQRVSIQDICEIFSISRDTARRDLLKMDELAMIHRTHGGAVLPPASKEIYKYKDRLVRQSGKKRAIGLHAASLVRDGDFILMDASTTVQVTADHLSARDVVVVTNSIDIADALSRKEEVRTYLLGGELNPQHRFLYGQSTIAKLADYQVDKLFLGACGITASGLSYPHEEDGDVKREMIRRADQVIVLADHTKFGQGMFYKIAGLESIDLLITDRQPDQPLMDMLAEHKVELLIVPDVSLDGE
ncbi:DeoR/GlpR family DNA-binding transcription regulator [Paenibacillus nasutitermitis]|uniref:HTH-type transcriptional repressor GlcR n=1 Tax=Paenibacillus nasutitermitis TaxID=1652958 RepID=A0A916Z8A8_9BACL|nr:DeoR/GlpR family DNA-binding transcription regulator [Paenibacillus nasutitermitis]GGD81167.1 HTH-type transcriptional repressor GlcR [Paenibacillus nasutitermitis]